MWQKIFVALFLHLAFRETTGLVRGKTQVKRLQHAHTPLRKKEEGVKHKGEEIKKLPRQTGHPTIPSYSSIWWWWYSALQLGLLGQISHTVFFLVCFGFITEKSCSNQMTLGAGKGFVDIPRRLTPCSSAGWCRCPAP